MPLSVTSYGKDGMEYTLTSTTGDPWTPRRERPSTPMADFLRYHVLIRVFQGHAGEWQDLLSKTSRGNSDDARFLRWVQKKLDSAPRLLDEIRGVVERTGLWPEDDPHFSG